VNYSLIAAAPYELKDKRSLEIIKQFPDVEIFRNIQSIISESWLVDRSNVIKLPFGTYLLDEHKFPIYNTNVKDLESVMIDRAKHFIDINKKIYLWWSGGIDSTAALIAFILAGVKKDQLTVVCNYDSIKEYPLFYNDYILDKFPILASELMMQNLKYQKISDQIVSCEHGDLMYGQDLGMIMFNIFGEEYLKKKLSRNTVTKFFQTAGMSDQASNCWFDIFTYNLHQSPRPIENMYDFSWWTGNNWRWQWAIEKVRMRTEINTDISTFYSGKDLQSWSAFHRQHDIKTKSDFKKEFKDFIFKFNKDKVYYDTKIKYASATIYYGADSFSAIRNDKKRIRSKDFSVMDYYQRNNFISDWLKS